MGSQFLRLLKGDAGSPIRVNFVAFVKVRNVEGQKYPVKTIVCIGDVVCSFKVKFQKEPKTEVNMLPISSIMVTMMLLCEEFTMAVQCYRFAPEEFEVVPSSEQLRCMSMAVSVQFAHTSEVLTLLDTV